MQLAVSSIAWERADDPELAGRLQELGVSLVEIAPTKIWADPLAVPAAEVAAYRRWWEARGFRIVALQSLVFGRPDLVLFGARAARDGLLEHLAGMCHLAAGLGASVLVFGAPKNRLILGRDPSEVREIAVDFFRSLAGRAAAEGVTFCIEPNPVDYGADFVTNSADGAELVRAVGVEGFGLHLDAAAMTLAGEDPAAAIAAAVDVLTHFHVSERYLAPVPSGTVDHPRFARALETYGYKGVRSIEMLCPAGASSVDLVPAAVNYASDIYAKGSVR